MPLDNKKIAILATNGFEQIAEALKLGMGFRPLCELSCRK